MWVVRLGAEAPRYLAGAAALLGLVASMRFALAPPAPVAREQPAGARAVAAPDRGAEAFATGFVRRYLTWDAEDPSIGAQPLERYFGAGFEPDGGLELPPSGAQRVQWAEVIQARPAPRGGHVFTIAAQTSSVGVLYLSVGVDRSAAGSLSLTGYPALVGAPPYDPSSGPAAGRAISDQALVTVVQRALRNYLAGATADLEADLALGAHVSTPTMSLSLEAMQRPHWTGSGVVLAVVQARDTRGVQYTLAYQLGVAREQGRWEITGVQST